MWVADERYSGTISHDNGMLVDSGKDRASVHIGNVYGGGVGGAVINQRWGGAQPPPQVGHNQPEGRAQPPPHQEKWYNCGGRQGQSDPGRYGQPPPQIMDTGGNFPRQVHRLLLELMTGHHQKFRGCIDLPGILKANNKKMLDLPYLNACME